MAIYRLDPAHYYTAPSLACDVMLKHTKKGADHDMYIFVEVGIRGIVSQCSQRYGKANNPYAPGHDVTQPTS